MNNPEEFYIWHDLKLATHSDTRNPYNKTEAQLDFLLICKKGICYQEVKGGQVEFHNSEFSFRHEGNLELMKHNPLKQVEGYKYTLKKRCFKNIRKNYIFDVCAFPFTNIDFLNKEIYSVRLSTLEPKPKEVSL